MKIKELLEIISNLPDDTVLLIEENDICEVETLNIQIHADGRVHLIFSALEWINPSSEIFCSDLIFIFFLYNYKKPHNPD